MASDRNVNMKITCESLGVRKYALLIKVRFGGYNHVYPLTRKSAEEYKSISENSKHTEDIGCVRS